MKSLFLQAAEKAGDMADLAEGANTALMGGSYAEWDRVEHEMDDLANKTADDSLDGEKVLWNIAEKLWDDEAPQEFKPFSTCVEFYKTVMENSNDDGEFDFNVQTTVPAALFAMEADIKCYRDMFKSAEEIDDDMSEKTVEEAFDTVADVYKVVYRVSIASRRFHYASQIFDAAREKFEAQSLKKKEVNLLEQLLANLRKKS